MLVIGALAGSVATPLAGTVYYAAPTVLGTGDGLSPGNAFQICSFTRDSTRAVAGNKLWLLDGHYTGLCSMIQPATGLSGDPGSLITVMALNDGAVDIDGEGARSPLRLNSTNNYWHIEGIDFHSSNTSVCGIQSSNNILRRAVCWDGPDDYNYHVVTVTGTVPWDTVHGVNNLIEDVAAFGYGRKSFENFNNTGNTFRRIYARPERSLNSGPKRCFQDAYHSGGAVVDNMICHGGLSLMPSTYVLKNNGSDYVGGCAGGTPGAGNTCGYPGTVLVNEPAGWVGEAQYTPASDTWHVDSNVVMNGLLGLVVAAPYDTQSDVGLAHAQGFFGHKTYGGNTVSNVFIYIAPGVTDRLTGALPMGLKLSASASCPATICGTLVNSSGSTLGGATVIAGGAVTPGDAIDAAKWTVTNKLSGTDLSVLGSGSLYVGGSGPIPGAALRYRYVDGVLTDKPLWPWPMASRILAATTKASADSHGHAIEDVDTTVQTIFGAYPSDPLPPPVIEGFSPATGFSGTSVVITGTNLSGATSVTFDGSEAAITFSGPTQVSATVPAGAKTGRIAVTTPGGTATGANAFTVRAAPTIVSFNPVKGPADAAVVITGTNFGGTSLLTFNGKAAAFTVESTTQITATVPSGATTGRIKLATPDGIATSAANFKITAAPVIASFSLWAGVPGDVISIVGADLDEVTRVTFNGRDAALFTANTANQITATVPLGASTGRIAVTAPDGIAVSPTDFRVTTFWPVIGRIGTTVTIAGTDFTEATNVTFNAVDASFVANSDTLIIATVPIDATTGPIAVTTPDSSSTTDTDFTVTRFSPLLGPENTAVAILGRFAGATQVTFNGLDASFTADSDDQVTAMVPAGATTGPITVTSDAGTMTTETDFTVTPFSPVLGPVGTTVTIAGSNFTGATGVTFNNVAASFSVDSDDQVTETVPAGSTTGPIAVTTPDGVSASASHFTVTSPAIVSFTPAAGNFGAAVVITGANFGEATSVQFNGTAASFAVDAPMQITATVPDGSTTGSIAVTTPIGTALSSADFIVHSPVISSFSPDSGSVGTSVVITGTNFTGASSVMFSAASATFTVNSPTQITAAVPSSAATGEVVVTAPGGTATSASSFTVIPAPAITSFSPGSGPVGAAVVITGTDLAGATSVKFNGTSAASFAVDSPTQITATVPSGATTGTITVTTPGGTATSASSFTVIPAPAVTSFSPTSGPVGASVIITGADLTGATSVKVNGTSAAIFTVDSSTRITATVPSGATTGLITVTTPGGTGTSATSFTVIPAPAISSFSPTSGPVGASVEITGTNLTGSTSVTFNGAASTSYAVDSSTQITAVVPAGATTGTIEVTTPGGTDSSATSFTVIPAPAITSFSPTSGPVGTTVVITGTNLTGATTVTFNGTSATALTVDSPTQITAAVPSGATTGVIVVNTPGGTGTSATSFTVIPAPAITSFSPTSGPLGASVVITGTNLIGAASVKFNGVSATIFVVDSSIQITATVPPGATTGPIVVTTPGGTAASASSFTVIPAPTISGYAPTSGPVGTEVVITGTNFDGASAVTFNGTGATDLNVDSPTQITALVPSGATTGPIEVATPGGTAPSAGSFTVIPAPAIASFSPASGPVGTAVVLTGSDFSGTTAVNFNGTTATSFTVDSPSQITATVPSGATTGPIVVTTPGGTAASASSFTVIPAPTVSGFSPASGPVGTSVVITGTSLTGATSVRFNGVSATFTVNSSTQITAPVPAGATTGTIVVTTPGGTAGSAGSFTVIPAPTVAGFSPASGPLGTTVVLTGTNLTGATSVRFNGTSATFAVNGSTQITATAPSGATTGPIAVTTPGGTAASTGNFTVIAAPTITSFAPTTGPAGTSVVITGTSLTGATAVNFNGSGAAYAVNSSTRITATVPPGATTGTITVTTPGGTAASASTFTVIPAPAITGFNPTSGVVGTSVVISGTNFTGATSVRFNGSGATFALNSPTQITAAVPPGATTGPIAVTTPGGTATSGTGFTVIPAPTIASFNPTSGFIGTNVIITGTNLNGATSVTFNGAAASYTVNSPTQITAPVPFGTTTGAIAVTTPFGTAISVISFSPLVQGDVGPVGLAGSGTYSSGTFTVLGSGAGIGGTSDQFHYVYQALPGDGEIQVKILSVQNTNASARAGVMIREGLNANAKYAMMALRQDGRGFFQRRTTTGGSTGTSETNLAFPYWVKLVRAGSIFTAYRSSNGTTWTALGSPVSIPMSSSATMGLAVTSSNNTALNTSTFTNLLLTQPPPTNHAPLVTSPGNQSGAENDVVSLQIAASDPDDDTLIYSASGLPGGLTINGSTGLISGTISASASVGSPYAVTVTATDPSSAVGSASFNWTVIQVSGGLPAPWVQQDVGAVGRTGSGTYSSGTFSVLGSGAGIAGTADQFHYVYQALTGDGEIQAKVLSVQNTNPSSRAGVMIRDGVGANARYAMMALRTDGRGFFQRRIATGGSTATSETTLAIPYWVKLVRSGNNFTAYRSSNGTTWTALGSPVSIPMASTATIGLAVTSNNNTTLNTSTFSNVTVIP